MIAIENIFIETMNFNFKKYVEIEKDSKDTRAIGFFIGPNFYLENGQ